MGLIRNFISAACMNRSAITPSIASRSCCPGILPQLRTISVDLKCPLAQFDGHLRSTPALRSAPDAYDPDGISERLRTSASSSEFFGSIFYAYCWAYGVNSNSYWLLPARGCPGTRSEITFSGSTSEAFRRIGAIVAIIIVLTTIPAILVSLWSDMACGKEWGWPGLVLACGPCYGLEECIAPHERNEFHASRYFPCSARRQLIQSSSSWREPRRYSKQFERPLQQFHLKVQ